jgi:hypothetical protein
VAHLCLVQILCTLYKISAPCSGQWNDLTVHCLMVFQNYDYFMIVLNTCLINILHKHTHVCKPSYNIIHKLYTNTYKSQPCLSFKDSVVYHIANMHWNVEWQWSYEGHKFYHFLWGRVQCLRYVDKWIRLWAISFWRWFIDNFLLIQTRSPRDLILAVAEPTTVLWETPKNALIVRCRQNLSWKDRKPQQIIRHPFLALTWFDVEI